MYAYINNIYTDITQWQFLYQCEPHTSESTRIIVLWWTVQSFDFKTVSTEMYVKECMVYKSLDLYHANQYISNR